MVLTDSTSVPSKSGNAFSMRVGMIACWNLLCFAKDLCPNAGMAAAFDFESGMRNIMGRQGLANLILDCICAGPRAKIDYDMRVNSAALFVDHP